MSPIKHSIYLASRSARRRELLRQIGIHHSVLLMRETLTRPADIDEAPLPDEASDDYIYRVTHAKAEAGWLRIGQRGLPVKPVLAADTVVVLDGCILGKPRDPVHAKTMLTQLSGREHQVYSAIGLAFEQQIRLRLSVSTLRLREISPQEIETYVASGEAHDKAGAYSIQGKAAAFIIEMSGSYSGVMGLPLFETAQLLEETGIPVFAG